MSQADQRKKRSRTRRRAPLTVNMTLVVRTGEAPEDCITIMDDRELRMVGSVFAYRDRIRRFLGKTLVRVISTSPSVYRELMPGLMTAVRGFGRRGTPGRQNKK